MGKNKRFSVCLYVCYQPLSLPLSLNLSPPRKYSWKLCFERNTEVSKRGQKGRFSPLIDNHQKGFHTEKKTVGGVSQTGTSQNTKFAPDPSPPPINGAVCYCQLKIKTSLISVSSCFFKFITKRLLPNANSIQGHTICYGHRKTLKWVDFEEKYRILI